MAEAVSHRFAAPGGLVDGADGPLVAWREGDGGRFIEPFFEEMLTRWRRAGGASWMTPLSALETDGADPAALIFHVSRCGSTLLARMLAALPGHLVISEAPILDDLLRRTPAADDGQRIAWLRGAMAAFVRSQAAPPARLIVKLDCWHIFQLPLLRRAFPRTPCLFVHRDPIEVLVSLMAMPSVTLIRDTVTPAQLGLSEAERNGLSREAHAAAILGAFFREALAHRGELTAIGYRELPEAALTALSGVAFTVEEQALMRAAALQNAKAPEELFTPDTERKRREASPELLAAAARWALPAYERWLAASS